MTASHSPESLQDLFNAGHLDRQPADRLSDDIERGTAGWKQPADEHVGLGSIDDPDLEAVLAQAIGSARDLLAVSEPDQDFPALLVMRDDRGDTAGAVLPQLGGSLDDKAAGIQVAVPALMVASGASAAALVSLAWIAKAQDAGGKFVRPSLDPERREAVSIIAQSRRDDLSVSYTAGVTRHYDAAPSMGELINWSQPLDIDTYQGEFSFWMRLAFRSQCVLNQGRIATVGAMDEAEFLEVASAFSEWAERVHSAGRNEPCPCGSGSKAKRCCGALLRHRFSYGDSYSPADVTR